MSNAEDSPLGRAFRIIETLLAHRDGLTLSEIAVATDLVIATAHRQLHTLISLGAVRKLNNRAFVLGDRIWLMASRLTNGADVNQSSASVLKELAEEFGETSYLARLVGETLEVMSTCTPIDFGQASVQPGRGMPLYAAATGKILLAFSPDRFIDNYLKQPRPAYTPNTKVDEADIRAEIAQLRNSHVAVCDNEFDPGILSYAAAVEDRRTGLTYGLAVFGLADRLSVFDRSEVEEKLLAASQRLSAILSIGV